MHGPTARRSRRRRRPGGDDDRRPRDDHHGHHHGGARARRRADGAQPLTIAGYTYSQEGVARLLSRLAVVPALQHVKLVSSTQTTVGGQTVVSFSIQADRPASGDGMSKLPTEARIAVIVGGDRRRARRRLVHS